MGAEFGVVQLSNGIGHVLFAHKLYNSGSISVNVGVAHVACLTHVVLQVLPAAALREPRHNDPVLGSSGRWPVSASRCPADPTEAASGAPAAPWKLHSQSVAVVVVPITPIDCIVGVPRVLEFNKGERRPSSPVLQVDVSDRPVFVEHVLHIFGADVRGQVSNVNSAVVVPSRASHDTRHRGYELTESLALGKITNGCCGLTEITFRAPASRPNVEGNRPSKRW